MIHSLQPTLLKELTMNANKNKIIIFNSYPRPATLNLPASRAEVSTSPSWLARVWAALGTASTANTHEESCLWDIATSESSVITQRIQGFQRKDSENGAETPLSTAPTAVASKAPAAQGLSVLLERVYQSRQRHHLSLSAS